MLLAEQVREPQLELARGAARGHQRALEGLAVERGERVREPLAVGLGGEAVQQAAAEHAGHRRARVGHRAVRVEHDDQVRGLADERAEARLAAPAVELEAERPLAPDQRRHARHDDREQRDRAELDDDEVEVAVADVVGHRERRGDERGAGQQDQAEARQRALAAGDGLGEPRHRRVQAGDAPEHVAADPAGVEPQLRVEIAVQRHDAVDEVGRREQRDAGDQGAERGLAPARVEREADRGAEQDHVAHRVGDRRHLRPQPDVALVQVRGDQRDPGRERQADRQHEAVQQPAAVGAAAAAPHEQQQAGHQHRVHRDVAGVAERRERHRPAGEALVVVRVEVAEPEQRRAGGEQQPGGPRRGPVAQDAEGDREHRREAERVHEDAAAAQRADQVRDGAGDSEREVDDPGSRATSERHVLSNRRGASAA